MNAKLIRGVLLLGVGIFLITTSEGHNVGYITTAFGVFRIFQGLRGG